MSKRAEDSPVQRNWFALYTRPRSEFKAEIQLNSIEILNYLPVTTQIKQWSDRKKKVTEPLLRGYIFIYATEKERLISLEQNAVIRCVSERGRAAVIPEDQMNNLRSFIQKEMQYDVYEGLVPGTKIRITHGPFAGVEGVVSISQGGKQLAVSVELLNRTILTYIAESDIQKIAAC